MSSENLQGLNQKLVELKEWQNERQKKLREFQHTKKKLLDSEHHTAFNSLNIQLSNWVPKIFNKALSKENYDTEILQINNSCNVKSSFPPTRQTLKGCESQQGPMNTDIQPKLNEDDSIHKKQEGQEQRRFLRRGDGLARFRMSLEDFKSPPKIYKDKRIKTYLNKKSEILKGCQSKNFKTIKHSKVLANNGLPQIKKKTLSLPVNIYLPQNKTQKTCSAVKMELKQDTRQLDLEQIQNSNYGEKKKGTSKLFYPLLGEQKTGTGNCKKSLIVQENDCIAEPLNEEEIERKRDDRELKEFEILEQKVNESSFCSTSSLIDKLMEQSTVSHLKINEKNIKESVRNLKPMHCKYPVEDQIEKMEKLDYICHSKANNLPKIEGGKCEIQYKIDPLINEIEKERKIEMDEEKSWVSLCTDTDKSKHKNTNQKESELCHIQSEKKKVEQECKQNSKYLQSNFKESSDGITFNQTELFPKCVGKQQQRQINQHEIALKLQRKSLQDNVKQLLNWEYSPHKKSPKRIHKKLKPKIKKVEKSKSLNKEQSEKIILNNALLKERLDELQKEIIIFRRENSKVEKLQKECHEERIKLSKEKKEFERIMQEEKEKFEAKILESHKKLQKERNVFETYCKQKNNRFSRQEREELAELKKEIEKLTETAATKETRWGASQARLRNQIRNLEKENIRLKTENEKLKKLSFKRVTFGNDKNLDAKIIQVINAELEKLKPTIISPGFTCSCSTLSPQSATSTLNKSDTVKGKLLRRINSAPTMRKDLIADVNDEISCQREGKVLFSISTDSGIETSEIKNSSQIISENRNSTLNSSLVGCRCLEEASKSQLEDADQELCSRSLTRGEKQSDLNIDIENDSFAFTPLESTTDEEKTDRSVVRELELQKKLKEVNNIKSIGRENTTYLKNNCSLLKKVLITSEGCNGGKERRDNNNALDVEEGNKSTESLKTNNFKGLEIQRREESLMSRLKKSKPEDIDVRETIFEDGTKEIFYPSGNVKKISPDNNLIRIVYYNGDIKETNIEDGSEKYYYSETETWHTTYKDGMEVLEFPTGQTERRYPNGSSEISFPNGCVRYCDSFGRDEWRFLDGTVIKTNENGHKILLMQNGQKEIHTRDFKQREYPDGTIKILYSNGAQETRYASGRVRLKDESGNLVMDSGGL